jgi:hypothetical protein
MLIPVLLFRNLLEKKQNGPGVLGVVLPASEAGDHGDRHRCAALAMAGRISGQAIAFRVSRGRDRVRLKKGRSGR